MDDVLVEFTRACGMVNEDDELLAELRAISSKSSSDDRFWFIER